MKAFTPLFYVNGALALTWSTTDMVPTSCGRKTGSDDIAQCLFDATSTDSRVWGIALDDTKFSTNSYPDTCTGDKAKTWLLHQSGYNMLDVKDKKILPLYSYGVRLAGVTNPDDCKPELVHLTQAADALCDNNKDFATNTTKVDLGEPVQVDNSTGTWDFPLKLSDRTKFDLAEIDATTKKDYLYLDISSCAAADGKSVVASYALDFEGGSAADYAGFAAGAAGLLGLAAVAAVL